VRLPGAVATAEGQLVGVSASLRGLTSPMELGFEQPFGMVIAAAFVGEFYHRDHMFSERAKHLPGTEPAVALFVEFFPNEIAAILSGRACEPNHAIWLLRILPRRRRCREVS